MFTLDNLTPLKKKRKRIGRGGSRGGTSGKGHKGQKARSGGYHKVGFEGGQMPLFRRVPKFGFRNINRVEYRGINISTLQKLVEDKKVQAVNQEVLIKNGLAGKNDLIKILGMGELKAKLNVTAHAFSKSAISAIEAQGGKATKI